MSDTSFTKTVGEEEFSLDEDEDDGTEESNNTRDLLAKARQSVNIPERTAKRTAPTIASGNAKKSRGNSGQNGTNAGTNSKKVNKPAGQTTKSSVNFLNSDKWALEMRPPHLLDDDVFNAISIESASLQIMNWMTTKAMMASNNLKENKALQRGGKEKPDMEIKKIKVEAGEDDCMTTLHKQRFMFRTPLQAPKEYWHLVPQRWKEINKSLYLENIGMDNICSPRTLELLHDRSSPLEVKMFLTLNISVGRAGVSRKQNLRTLDDGTTEVVSSDDWLSPTNISQLIEALDNLVAIWVVMWPGEWSMVALRRAVTKHLAFGDIQNSELRKKVLEAYINEVLTGNASLAARGKPPMEFEKLDKLATKYLDNKKHFERSFKIVDTKDKPSEKDKSQSLATLTRNEVSSMRKLVGSLKTTSGKNACLYYNTTKGCSVSSCKFEHSCCYVKNDGKLCCGAHKMKEHEK